MKTKSLSNIELNEIRFHVASMRLCGVDVRSFYDDDPDPEKARVARATAEGLDAAKEFAEKDLSANVIDTRPMLITDEDLNAILQRMVDDMERRRNMPLWAVCFKRDLEFDF